MLAVGARPEATAAFKVVGVCPERPECWREAQPDQRCFLAIVAVKSGALFATQSTNLRTLG